MKISLLGYPNSGKTSIFNLLTNQNKKVANFSGVTVDAYEGTFNINKTNYTLVDLPGVNSLSSFSDSKDEIVVSKYVEDNKEDIYLNIVSITNLERNLLLTFSMLAKKMKTILVVNMLDTVKLSATEITNIQNRLEEYLKIPVIMFSAKKKLGVIALKEKITNYQQNKESVITADVSKNIKIIREIVNKLPKISGKSVKITNFLDKIFLNKILALPLFFIVIYVILLITLNIHIIFSGFIDSFAGSLLVNLPHKYLEGVIPNIALLFIADGIGGGIQTMLTFIPIIFTLFFLLGVLEQSGYMARQAFIADTVMQKLGLPGKAFISLVMGLGCTAACSGGCRTLERESDRRLSLMISPSISCSAKLPVYVYLCFITFGSRALNIVFLLYFLGIFFAVINGIFLSKSLFKSKPLPFIMDMPDYMIPNFSYILKNSYLRVKSFIIGLGKTIIPIIAIITLFSSISFKGEIVPANSNKNILAQASGFITPILSPMGIDNNNWQATLSLITGFLAKEVVVATMDALYFPIEKTENISILNEVKTSFNDLKNQLINRNHLDMFDIGSSYSLLNNIDAKKSVLFNKFGGGIGMFSFLLFALIYTPCISAMGAISREISKKWAWMVSLWSIFNAYMISTLFYQIATNYMFGLLWGAIFLLIYMVIFFVFRYYGNKSANTWNSNFVFSKKSPN